MFVKKRLGTVAAEVKTLCARHGLVKARERSLMVTLGSMVMQWHEVVIELERGRAFDTVYDWVRGS